MEATSCPEIISGRGMAERIACGIDSIVRNRQSEVNVTAADSASVHTVARLAALPQSRPAVVIRRGGQNPAKVGARNGQRMFGIG